jgi:hypothetical protein
MSIPSVGFVDRDCGEEAVVLVRVMDDRVGLGLSLKRNGDIEVVFGLEELDLNALQAARVAVRKSP